LDRFWGRGEEMGACGTLSLNSGNRETATFVSAPLFRINLPGLGAERWTG
jgi:hypothetical protein